jgi:hypothetical protein
MTHYQLNPLESLSKVRRNLPETIQLSNPVFESQLENNHQESSDLSSKKSIMNRCNNPVSGLPTRLYVGLCAKRKYGCGKKKFEIPHRSGTHTAAIGPDLWYLVNLGKFLKIIVDRIKQSRPMSSSSTTKL